MPLAARAPFTIMKSFEHNSAATDEHGFYLDKTVYVAVVAKMKAQLHKEPSAFAALKQRMLQYCQGASSDHWDDAQLAIESRILVATLESALPQHLSDSVQLRNRSTSELVSLTVESGSSSSRKQRRSVLEFLEKVKASCTRAKCLNAPLAVLGNPRMCYDTFIKLMQEYIDDKIVYPVFLRRGLDLCDGVSGDSKLQRRFIGQFCADIDLERLRSTATREVPLLENEKEARDEREED